MILRKVPPEQEYNPALPSAWVHPVAQIIIATCAVCLMIGFVLLNVILLYIDEMVAGTIGLIMVGVCGWLGPILWFADIFFFGPRARRRAASEIKIPLLPHSKPHNAKKLDAEGL